MTEPTTSRFHLVLVCNFRPDAQESMLRFAEMLGNLLSGDGITVEHVRPEPYLHDWFKGLAGLKKWAGYFDKLILFPKRLKRLTARYRHSGTPVIFHILDHSNSIYLRHLKDVPHLVTCHDLIAVKAARGQFPGIRTRSAGRALQRSILTHLCHANYVACDSVATRQDLLTLTALPPERTKVIHLPLNHPYRQLSGPEAEARLHGRLIKPYLLHVGSNAWYKNREGLLRLFARIEQSRPSRWQLVIVGQLLTPALKDLARSLRIESSLVEWENPTNDILEALYSKADALLFPSLTEGFGWPVLEAQACGCPVLTSAREPMQEIAGEAAMFCHPEDPVQSAEQLIALLENSEKRRLLIEAGTRNVARFDKNQTRQMYLSVYQQLLSTPRRIAID